MSKGELQKQKEGQLVAPDFIAQDSGLGDISQYIIPPRVKIVQKQSDDSLLQLFNVGDVIITPQHILVAEIQKGANNKSLGLSDPFYFVPLFFFVEWIQVNPIELKGSEPFVRDRTFDPKHELALKAKNKDTWFEQHPDKEDLKIRNIEVLNFMIALINHELSAVPAVLSFSKGGYRDGSNLLSLIKLRRAAQYGCQFEARSVLEPNNPKGQYYRIQASNPAADSGVTPFVESHDTYNAFEVLHKEFKEAHAQSKIQVDYASVDDDDEIKDSGEF